MRIGMPTLLTLGVLVAAGLMLSSCKEDEQGRPLRYEQGKYSGKPDTEISEETRESLRGRAEMQNY